uniref:Uncharacterized protein n=1 Tax=Cacopsylla melanoneura TaxID=428564 RepID=A0A8D8X0J9_9HEMI
MHISSVFLCDTCFGIYLLQISRIFHRKNGKNTIFFFSFFFELPGSGVFITTTLRSAWTFEVFEHITYFSTSDKHFPPTIIKPAFLVPPILEWCAICGYSTYSHELV